MLAGHADVEENPENQARAELIKGFNIKVPDGWVQFTPDKELEEGISTSQRKRVVATHIVYHVARVPSQRQKLALPERAKVASQGLDDSHDEGSGEEADPFIVEERESVRSEADNDSSSDPQSQ